MNRQKLLLKEDVYNLGRKGDMVSVRIGYARNYLIPQRKAVLLDKNAERIQERLKEERARQAANDLKEAEALASQLQGIVLTVTVKVDPEGHMYGSVSSLDVIKYLMEEKKIELDKRYVKLAHPIKTIGLHKVPLALKENVTTEISLKVLAEGMTELPEEKKTSEQEEVSPENNGETVPE